MAVASRILALAMAILSSLEATTLEIDAKLLEATPTPSLVEIRPYPQALCTYLYEVQRVHAGEYTGERILVVKWAVRESKLVKGLPSKIGSIERLKLDRWIDHKQLSRERIVDAIKEHDLIIYYDPSSIPSDPLSLLEGREKEMESGVLRGGEDGWLFLTEELRHAATGAFWEKDWTKVSRAQVDPLPAMLDFQKRLAALNTRLLIVPVPTKVAIYPEQFKPGTVITPQATFAKQLRAAGLNVLDLEPVFREHLGDPFHRALYLAQDSHWSPEGCRVAARAIFERINPRSETLPNWVIVSPNQTTDIHGDLARLARNPELPKERVALDRVTYDEKWPSLPRRHPASPVALIGDSHVAVFSDGGEDLHGEGAGLPDYLFLEFGYPVDVTASYGDGVNQARVNLYQRWSRDPKSRDYWDRKEWVIWCFSAREFTQATGWSSKIPVVPPETNR